MAKRLLSTGIILILLTVTLNVDVTAASSINLVGKWSVWIGSGTEEILEITSQNGNSFTGTISNVAISKGTISGNKISFTRDYPGSDNVFFLTGFLTIYENHKLNVNGTYIGTNLNTTGKWFGGKKEVVTSASNITIDGLNKLTTVSNVFLNEQLNFKLDGVTVYPIGDNGNLVLPITYNGTSYLPIRAMGYLLGLGIDWDPITSTVLISSTTDKTAPIAMNISKANQLYAATGAQLNGNLKFKLNNIDVSPTGDDGRVVIPITYKGTTYLPIRAMGYLLGLGIDWDATTSTVLMSTVKNTSPLDVSGTINKFSSDNTKIELYYNISGGNLEKQISDGIYATWHVENYIGTIRRGETITITASGLREMPPFLDSTYSYRPTTLKTVLSSDYTWYHEENYLVVDENEYTIENIPSSVLSYTVPANYSKSFITVNAYMKAGYNFPGYPYGADGEYIARVIYYIID